jgi:hypothetical protein
LIQKSLPLTLVRKLRHSGEQWSLSRRCNGDLDRHRGGEIEGRLLDPHLGEAERANLTVKLKYVHVSSVGKEDEERGKEDKKARTRSVREEEELEMKEGRRTIAQH